MFFLGDAAVYWFTCTGEKMREIARVVFAFNALIASSFVPGTASGESDRPCLGRSDPVAGILRKVTSRTPSSRELVTNWHLETSEPLCVNMGDDDKVRGVTDIQVEFSKKVDERQLDQQLGLPVGVRGHIAYWRNDRDTASMVVIDAVLFDDLDDAGEIRQR